jgi:hypothetical protein
MSLVSVVKDVCASVGVPISTSVFSNITGNRTMQEILSLANEMVQRIAYDTREWNILKNTCILQGDGTTVDFNLPADFKRMLLTANVWRSTSALYPMRFIPDLDEWNQRRARQIYSPKGEWIIYGNQMHIIPVMGSNVTASFGYMKKNCVVLTSGGYGTEFLSDTDSFILDERLLKLGMIWQWKAQKGSAYAEDMGTYGDAIMMAMGADLPAPIIVGRSPISKSMQMAYPYALPDIPVP